MTQLSLFAASASAEISPCGLYRYALHRRWDEGPQVLWVLLNPSKADATNPDNTMTKCVNFARRWGYGGIAIANLFAFRATDPRDLKKAADPIGFDNDHWLRLLASESQLLIAGWGNDGAYRGRDKAVRTMLAEHDLCYLRLTKEGQPHHPLYLPYACKPTPWSPR